MAHFDDIPVWFINPVALEVGKLIDRGFRNEDEQSSPPEDAELQITESLAVWKLNKAAYKVLAYSVPEGDMINWTEATPFSHHQIRLRGQAEGFARAQLEGGTERKVVQVTASPIAARLNELFKMIDANKEGDAVVAADPVVRLLEIPPFQVVALWLFAEKMKQSRIVIVRAPKRYEELAGYGFLDSEKFFRGLKRVGPLKGVT